MAGEKQFDLFDMSGQHAEAVPAVDTSPAMIETNSVSVTPAMTPSTVSPPTAAVSRVIADAGQELVANRRNRTRKATGWADVENLNDALKVREVVKANVWPKPDYKQLIASGMKPLIAHIVKQVYDSVAAKPVLGYGKALDDGSLIRYIEALNRVETGLTAWSNDREAIKDWVEKSLSKVGGMLGHRISVMDLAPDKSLLDLVYPGGSREFGDQLKLAGGNKLYGALQPGYQECKRGLDAIRKGWPEKREAWEIQGFSVVTDATISVESYKRKDGSIHLLNVNDRSVKSFETRELADEAGTKLQPFVLFGKRGFIDSFATEDEAIAAAKNRARRDKTETISDKGVRVEAVEREGIARRMPGEDISAERMVAEFGLKGVNFGNWMKTPSARLEAQLHLNHAFDSFHDLAEILGVPPKALSLNGMLGLAIGAQGAGGAYAAHFVPGVNEINLTRTSGAGSLGHEFGHALDHYFAAQGGLSTATEPFMTEHASFGATRAVTHREGNGFVTKDVPRFGELRPEIVLSFKRIVEAMNKRPETEEEADAALSVRQVKNQRNLGAWLKAIRKDFAGQEEAFDVLASRVEAGDVGEGRIALSSRVSVCPVVSEMRDLYKAAHGRVYPIENLKNLQAGISQGQHLSAKALADGGHVPQMVSTDYATNARKLDEEKGGKQYWSTNLEKFARAFDAFVSDELEARGAKNGYLSHTGRQGNTVPMAAEREAINVAFRGLVGALQVRETEHGPALASISANGVQQPLPMAVLQAEISRIRRQWPSMPPVHVVQTTADLSFKLNSNADGGYYDGQVYVIANNVADVKQLQKVLAHECVLHHSLIEMLGAYGFSKLHHGLQKLKEQGDPVVLALAADIQNRYGALPPEMETMEIVASAGEQCLDEKGNIRVEFGFMKGVFASIAGWLRDHGISFPFSNTELQGIMHNAGEWIKRDPIGTDRGADVSLSHATGEVLHSFAGVRAETAPLDALRLAREMKLSGIDDRTIWTDTGWTFGFADGKPRFEISDDQASIVVEGRTFAQVWLDMAKVDPSVNNIGQFLVKYPESPLTAEVNNHQGVRAAYEGLVTDDPAIAREIENYLEHADLYQAYPALARIKAAQPPGIDGMVRAGAAAFVPDANLFKYSRVNNPDQFRSTTLHEFQHAIQGIEGFSPGGSPENFQVMDLTGKEVSRINEVISDIYERNPAFYRDSVKATQLHLAVVDKYGTVSNGPASDPLVQEWWGAIDQRDSHPEAKDWYALKSLARQVERDRIILSPEDQYSRLAGEVEARVTQARIDMSPEERRAIYPLDNMDFPVASQALRGARRADALVFEGHHVGKILDVSDGVATQRVNRDGAVVRHVVSALSAPVAIGQVVEIRYAGEQGVVANPEQGIQQTCR